MKKYIYIILFILFGAIIFQSFKPLNIMKKDGAAPGHTGSPGDSLKNCTVCHGGIAIPVKKWFRSNIPNEGYIPGNSYTITMFNTVVGATRFGFEFSPQDSLGNLLGSIVLTDTVKTKFVGGNKYITYTNNGIGSVDSMKWTFDWIAPPAGTGTVGFYGAFNSNFNHNKSNDQTFIGAQQIKENLSNSITVPDSRFQSLKIFPNPANSNVQISINCLQQEALKIDLLDLKGEIISNWVYEKVVGVFSKEVSTTSLSNGTYLMRVSCGNKFEVRKLNIIH